MKATDFEYRHQTQIHNLLILAGVLTYLVDPDDIVWRFVRDSSAPRFWERVAFIVATILIAIGAILCTRARAFYRPHYLGELVYAIGFGSLLPIPGFLILVFGESLRLFRLARREPRQPSPAAMPAWGHAFRREAVKWGIVITMLVFVTTLKDRHADVLAVSSFLIGLLLNAPLFRRRSGFEGRPAR
ncbi:MAG TPA: hypothetical protein VMB19_11590 [Silvibacterium sp.]|nr:hypothetical protein [Silvibacterium sp.]